MENYIVELNNINKAFPGVKALDNVKFNLKKGEVVALLGENGAGKSTLMKVLSGVETKDSGELKVRGEIIDDLNPKIAQELGIGIIHQELNLCPHLTIAENIYLGREKTRSGILSKNQMIIETKEVLKRLNIKTDPNTLVSDLSVSKQQMVEIAKALSMNAEVLIMDEPTSALTSSEVDELFKIINNLKNEGCAIVYISHRLEELEHITDRVTVMRDGQYITTMNFSDTTIDGIISKMVGREITEKFPHLKCKRGQKIMEVRNLNAGRLVRNINFELYEGEIVGIAGLMGAGRTETTRAIFGADPIDSGEVYLADKLVDTSRPLKAIQSGIVLVPEDRKKDGLCTKLDVKDNITLPNLDILSNKYGFIQKKKEKKMVEEAISDLNIKLANAYVNAGTLSGGNQQKVVVAKWLSRNSRVVIFDEPTRGIDVASKVEIYNLMNTLKKQGIGVLFVSSEMPEVLGMSDRILVMCDGKITADIPTNLATQDKIMEYATQYESKLKKVINE